MGVMSAKERLMKVVEPYDPGAEMSEDKFFTIRVCRRFIDGEDRIVFSMSRCGGDVVEYTDFDEFIDSAVGPALKQSAKDV